MLVQWLRMYICPYGCVYPMPAMFSKIITQWWGMYMPSHHIEAPNKDVYIHPHHWVMIFENPFATERPVGNSSTRKWLIASY